MQPSPLQERIELYLAMWQQSQPAARIDQVEGIALTHGQEPYEGQTVPEFWVSAMNDLLLFVADNPSLLEVLLTQEQVNKRVNAFLTEEQAKIDEAAKIVEEMKRYWLGPIDPRYRRAARRYSNLVKSFRIIDKNYQIQLPPLHELKN